MLSYIWNDPQMVMLNRLLSEIEFRVDVVLAQDVCLMPGGMQIDEYKIGAQD